MDQESKSALDRIATAIEAEAAERKAERERKATGERREAALISGLLLLLVSLSFLDIVLGDPGSKVFFQHQAQLPVLITLGSALVAFLYKAFRTNVISLNWILYFLLFFSAIAAFIAFLLKGYWPRIGGTLIGLFVFSLFIRDYVPTDIEWQQRLDRFERWVNSKPRIQTRRGILIALAIAFALPLAWAGYVIGLLPDQVGWLPGLIAWFLVFGLPLWEKWTNKTPKKIGAS